MKGRQKMILNCINTSLRPCPLLFTAKIKDSVEAARISHSSHSDLLKSPISIRPRGGDKIQDFCFQCKWSFKSYKRFKQHLTLKHGVVLNLSYIRFPPHVTEIHCRQARAEEIEVLQKQLQQSRSKSSDKNVYMESLKTDDNIPKENGISPYIPKPYVPAACVVHPKSKRESTITSVIESKVISESEIKIVTTSACKMNTISAKSMDILNEFETSARRAVDRTLNEINEFITLSQTNLRKTISSDYRRLSQKLNAKIITTADKSTEILVETQTRAMNTDFVSTTVTAYQQPLTEVTNDKKHKLSLQNYLGRTKKLCSADKENVPILKIGQPVPEKISRTLLLNSI